MLKAYESGVNFFDNAEVYAVSPNMKFQIFLVLISAQDGEAEVMMGKCLKRGPWKRSDLVISTKVIFLLSLTFSTCLSLFLISQIFWGGKGVNDQGLSRYKFYLVKLFLCLAWYLIVRKHIIEGTNASLKRMQVLIIYESFFIYPFISLYFLQPACVQLDYVDLMFCHRPDIHTPIEETVRAMNYLIDQGKAFYWGTSEWSAEQIRQAYEIARQVLTLVIFSPTL